MNSTELKSCLIVSLLVFLAALAAAAEGFAYISKDQLKSKLTNSDVVILDVRAPHDWDSSQIKIQGARRESPAAVAKWMGKYPKTKTIVLYCA